MKSCTATQRRETAFAHRFLGLAVVATLFLVAESHDGQQNRLKSYGMYRTLLQEDMSDASAASLVDAEMVQGQHKENEGALGTGLEGAQLEAAVKAASKAQAEGRKPAVVVSQIVAEAPQAELLNGNDDISLKGACGDAIKASCSHTKPGLGQLSKCLSEEAVHAMRLLGADILGSACFDEVIAYKIERSTNINKNVPLANACKDDVKNLCGSVKARASVEERHLACLRQHKGKLGVACAREVTLVQADAAADYRLDANLHAACRADAEQLCGHVRQQDGHLQEVGVVGATMQGCLRAGAKVSIKCQQELLRQEVENADDFKLSPELLRKCKDDKKKFCDEVSPGHSRVMACLEEHRSEREFRFDCRAALETLFERRSADFRLDARLRGACTADAAALCGFDAGQMYELAADAGGVGECLQHNWANLTSPACQGQVRRAMALAFSDMRFNPPLQAACRSEYGKLCRAEGDAPGSAITCLQSARDQLSEECEKTLFRQEVRMAQSLDFQPALKAACSAEVLQFCREVPHDRGRAIRCLEDNAAAEGFSPACRAQVEEYRVRAAQDFRLNFRLSSACHDTVARLCGDVCDITKGKTCAGKVLRCLMQKSESIGEIGCKNEVLHHEALSAMDIRNDFLISEACRGDVAQHCAGIKPGEARVHECLQGVRQQLSSSCREAEDEVAILQAANIDLNPKLNGACRDERGTHCKALQAGKSRVFRCLFAHAAEPDFGKECRKGLVKQQEKRMKDWRLDYNLHAACNGDVDKVCSDARRAEQQQSEGAVLQCLAGREANLTDSCRGEVVRSLSAAFKFYKKGMVVTKACDADAKRLCSMDREAPNSVQACLLTRAQLSADLSPRVVAKPDATTRRRRRLSASSGGLSAECEALVLLSEPGDAYMDFAAGLLQAGMRSWWRVGTEGWRDRSGLVLTGWAALAAAAALAFLLVAAATVACARCCGCAPPALPLLASKQQLVLKGGPAATSP